MFRRSAFSLLCAAIALTAAASAKPAAPLTTVLHMSPGAYTCASADKALDGTHNVASAMGGAWLSESDAYFNNLVSHDAAAHMYRVASLDRSGRVTVFAAPDTSSTHIPFKAVYPANVKQTTTFDSLSATQYRLTFDGTAHGKAFHDVLTCTKK